MHVPTVTSLARTVASLARTVASPARTMASLARTVVAEVSTKPLHLPPGSSAGFKRRAGSARVYGWDGWTEDQMDVSIFIILCGYIDLVCIYLYTNSKIFRNIVMGVNI